MHQIDHKCSILLLTTACMSHAFHWDMRNGARNVHDSSDPFSQTCVCMKGGGAGHKTSIVDSVSGPVSGHYEN